MITRGYFIALALLPSLVLANDIPRVLLLSPFNEDTQFGEIRHQTITAAAKDLGMALEIIPANDHHNLNREKMQSIFKSRPDYVLMNYLPHTEHVLKYCDENNIKALLLTQLETKTDSIGKPRERYKNWIGSISASEYDIGKNIINTLNNAENNYKFKNKTQNPSISNTSTILAFNGHRSTPTAVFRKKGLLESADKLDISIGDIYELSWDADIATKPLFTALKNHPEATLFWAASDDISLEIIKKMKSIGKIPNVDFFTVGVDWTLAGLESIERGEMLASVGGQLLDYSWAMVLLYDYHYGYDFSDYSLNNISPAYVIDSSNVIPMKEFIYHKGWNNINFKRYSRRHNSEFKGYRFDIMTLIKIEEPSDAIAPTHLP